MTLVLELFYTRRAYLLMSRIFKKSGISDYVLPHSFAITGSSAIARDPVIKHRVILAYGPTFLDRTYCSVSISCFRAQTLALDTGKCASLRDTEISGRKWFI